MCSGCIEHTTPSAAKPAQLIVGKCLGVFDAVAYIGTGARGGVRVECATNGAVANRMRDALKACRRELADLARVAGRIWPERMATLAAGVGFLQPRRTGLDHPVDEELRDTAAPERAALGPQPTPLGQFVVTHAGLASQRYDQSHTQPTARLQLS
jgi:hypothetical protein